jgi:CubicO group peptidase (beta-lactamase class C family)
MKIKLGLILVFYWSSCLGQKNTAAKNPEPADYFPPARFWQHQSPAGEGFDSIKLAEAIRFAVASETKSPRSMEINHEMTFGSAPYGESIGPFKDRGDQTGIIIQNGYIVAEWGEPGRVDMTHSVTKSFLSTVVGLAFDQGLIRDVNDTVADYMTPIEVYDPTHINRSAEQLGEPQLLQPFSSPHNRGLTWDVMLRQTSDWEGILWGKPDWADRPTADASQWLTRKREKAGTVFVYNDVRVNVLALAATTVWRRPLPQVLKIYIMDPIGASNTWRWNGYRNSWIVLDGQAVQSVSGGGHWGGGMFINAYDMARFGLLTLHKGNWNGKQLISQQWIKQSLTPGIANPGYGYMNFYLNTGQKYYPSAPASAFLHIGNGSNIIYVDPEHHLVMVLRWVESTQVDQIIKKVLEAYNH